MTIMYSNDMMTGFNIYDDGGRTIRHAGVRAGAGDNYVQISNNNNDNNTNNDITFSFCYPSTHILLHVLFIYLYAPALPAPQCSVIALGGARKTYARHYHNNKIMTVI